MSPARAMVSFSEREGLAGTYQIQVRIHMCHTLESLKEGGEVFVIRALAHIEDVLGRKPARAVVDYGFGSEAVVNHADAVRIHVKGVEEIVTCGVADGNDAIGIEDDAFYHFSVLFAEDPPFDIIHKLHVMYRDDVRALEIAEEVVTVIRRMEDVKVVSFQGRAVSKAVYEVI